MAKSKVEWSNLSKIIPDAPGVKVNLGEVTLKPECAGKTESGKRCIMYKARIETPYGLIPVQLTLDVNEQGKPVPRGSVKPAAAAQPAWTLDILKHVG